MACIHIKEIYSLRQVGTRQLQRHQKAFHEMEGHPAKPNEWGRRSCP